MRRKKIAAVGLSMAAIMAAAGVMSGCSLGSENNGKIQIEMIQYKMEAVGVFEELEEKFNATHDDIELKIDSPNDATTIMKTRFIREDYPDIIGIGGDMNYSNFLDAGLLMDISDYDGLEDVKQVYLDIDKELEFVPMDGVYAMPYAANAAGVLYNKDIFDEYGWEIPTTWDELISLCEDIQAAGLQPFYFGFRDTWTCLAPWNAISVDLAPSDVCAQVNRGETTFTENYREVAEKTRALLDYAQDDPFAYNYNDACTAFANGESVMYPIGSYAVPQIQSVNPDINIDSFVMPAGETEEENILNSGNDLQFSVMAECENKEAAYEVLRFLQEDENVQLYLDDQNAVPCKEGDFELAPMLDGMKTYIEEGKMADYQDHHYPSEMAVDAMIQTYLLDTGDNATDTFLKRFDTEWERYNRDIIRKVQEYQEQNPDAE
ncbi:MAG TPA: extracellular solute-binding protein [Candidatus Blautia pullicola]|jgi:raffinose/stachyose/melibiose transport system substrate-binding protein|uniref:Extracellular solute-binding protein n=1 Tax=Candidatus Blautia pullicola TaxID=2838498 RepID=A0A9D2FS07_9FIRM|nr:extracellular solute-binding protein [Candidatus Blautia pullicola]